jgi:hypothetical protein
MGMRVVVKMNANGKTPPSVKMGRRRRTRESALYLLGAEPAVNHLCITCSL